VVTSDDILLDDSASNEPKPGMIFGNAGDATSSAIRSGGFAGWPSGCRAKWDSVPDRSKEGLSTSKLVSAPPVGAELIEDDLWAFSSGKESGERGGKSAIDESVVLEPVPPPFELELPAECRKSVTFGGKKKRKVKKGTAMPRVEEPPVPSPEPEPAPSDETPAFRGIRLGEGQIAESIVDESTTQKQMEEVMMADEQVVEKQVSAESFESRPEIIVEPESLEEKKPSANAAAQTCPDRVAHLFDSKGWKGCRICRAWLSQITTELACTRFVEDDGYEIVH
jgi:hypothetical protein